MSKKGETLLSFYFPLSSGEGDKGGEVSGRLQFWTEACHATIICGVMISPERPRVLISRQSIEALVGQLAARIHKDYQNKPLLLVGVLKGSFIFLADLVRRLDLPVEIDFIGLSSYGADTESSGKVKVTKPLCQPVTERHVLVVEDIVDTGHTLGFLLDFLRKKKPLSIKVCSLLDKPSRREIHVPIDYVGFEVPNKFIVGYGIDWNEQYRCLPDIYFLERDPL